MEWLFGKKKDVPKINKIRIWVVPEENAVQVCKKLDELQKTKSLVTKYELNKIINMLFPDTKCCYWTIILGGGEPYIQEYNPSNYEVIGLSPFYGEYSPWKE